MGYLGRFQFSNSYLNRVSAMDCPKHLGLCYISKEDKKQALEDERIRNAIEGKFGQAKRRFSLNRVMAKLPSTSETAIAITFLVINLSTLLRQVFWAFLCLKWKNRTFSRSMMTINYDSEINQQLKLILVAK